MGKPAVRKIDSGKLRLEISRLIETTQKETLHKISQTGVLLYWHIGTRINSEVLTLERAEYGKNIIDQLATHLHAKFGSGFSRRIIYRCIQFAKTFYDEKIVQALSSHLKWSHFVALLNIDNPLKRDFYAEMCRIERWSVRTLNKQDRFAYV